MRNLASIVLCIIATLAYSQTQSQLNLMPLPASLQQGSGQLAITQSFSVAIKGTHDPALDAGVQRFTKQLSTQTGISFRTKEGATPTLTVHGDKPMEAVLKLGEDESYQLTVTDSGAQIT